MSWTGCPDCLYHGLLFTYCQALATSWGTPFRPRPGAPQKALDNAKITPYTAIAIEKSFSSLLFSLKTRLHESANRSFLRLVLTLAVFRAEYGEWE